MAQIRITGTEDIEETAPLLGRQPQQSPLLGTTESPAVNDRVSTPEQTESPTSNRSVLGVLAVLLIGVFVANADTTLLLATYGEISSEFDSLDSASWLLTSYMLARCGTQAIYGKLSNIYGRKAVLLMAYALFAVGCLICGIADSMAQLIIGRLISGAGGAGMHVIVSFVIADLVPQRDIALYRSYVNIAQTAGRGFGGPMGGWLAVTVGWRWSFIAQCPLTLLAAILVSWRLAVPLRHANGPNEETFRQKLRRIDFAGSLLLFLAIISLLLPLSLGGIKFSWNDPIIYVLLAGSSLLFLSFGFVEMRIAKEPIFPLYLLRNQDVVLPYALLLLGNLAQTLMMYAVPLYFQITKSASPAAAGSYLVPAVFGNTIGGLLTGAYVKRSGNYKRAITASSLISGIGHCLTTAFWTGNTSIFEALFIFPGGVGTGISNSSTFIALAAGVTDEEIAIAGSGLYLCGNIGTVLGVTIASSLLRVVTRTRAVKRLQGAPGDWKSVVERSLSDINYVKDLSPTLHRMIVESYVDGVRVCFGGAIVCSVMALVLGLLIREKRLH